MKLLVTLLVFLSVLIFAIVIGAQNEQMITVSFMIATQEMTVSTLIAICIVIGFVSAMFCITYMDVAIAFGVYRVQLKKIRKLLSEAKSDK